jgi:hypothetical protein
MLSESVVAHRGEGDYVSRGEIIIGVMAGKISRAQHTLNMHIYGRVEVQLHAFLISALIGGERPVSFHSCFTP